MDVLIRAASDHGATAMIADQHKVECNSEAVICRRDVLTLAGVTAARALAATGLALAHSQPPAAIRSPV